MSSSEHGIVCLLVSPRPPVLSPAPEEFLHVRLGWTLRRRLIPQYLVRFLTGGEPAQRDHSCHACHWAFVIGFSIRPRPIPAWFIISWVHSSSSINDPPRLSSQFRLLIFLFIIGPKHTLRRLCDLPTLTQGSHSAQSPHLKPPWTFPFPASDRPNCVSSNINDAFIGYM